MLLAAATYCEAVSLKMATNKTEKLQNLICKIDHDVCYSSFKVICDFQYPYSPVKVLPTENLGHLMAFYLFLSTFFSSIRLRVSHFLPLILGVGKSAWYGRVIFDFSFLLICT